MKLIILQVSPPKENYSTVKYKRLKLNQIKMDLFDKLTEKNIVVNDLIKQTYEDFVEEIAINDLIRSVHFILIPYNNDRKEKQFSKKRVNSMKSFQKMIARNSFSNSFNSLFLEDKCVNGRRNSQSILMLLNSYTKILLRTTQIIFNISIHSFLFKQSKKRSCHPKHIH